MVISHAHPAVPLVSLMALVAGHALVWIPGHLHGTSCDMRMRSLGVHPKGQRQI